MKQLIWKIDLLIYRIFYWRWSARIKSDPNLAYMFAKFTAAWSKEHPPTKQKEVDAFVAAGCMAGPDLPN